MLWWLLEGCFYTGPVPVDELFTGPEGSFDTALTEPPTTDPPREADLDDLPPVVVATTPAVGATDVASGAVTLEFSFSRPMLSGTFGRGATANADIFRAEGTFAAVGDRGFTIEVELEPASVYRVWLNPPEDSPRIGFLDQRNNKALAYSWTFATAGAPGDPAGGFEGAVVHTMPESGRPDVDPGLDQVEITFSKSVAPDSFTTAVALAGTELEVSGTNWIDDRTVQLDVQVEPGRTYGLLVRATDTEGIDVPPYLVAFTTAE